MTTILFLSLVGIAALIAELVLPGGILGVVGGLCLLGAVVATFFSYGSTAGTIALAALVAIGLVTLWLWMKLFHRLPFTKQLVLEEAVRGEEAARARASLIGRTGFAVTDLMPSGRAEIGGERVDVVAESSSIPKGTPVLVVGVNGPSIAVRVSDGRG